MSASHYVQGNNRRGKRNGKRNAPSHVLSTTGIPLGTFAVIDPFSKKLFIPLEHMHDTRAMHRAGVPSLCCIFLQGRCRQGVNCFQAHADVDVVSSLRALALAQPSCCLGHGAASDTCGLPANLVINLINDSGCAVASIPLTSVVVTNGLRTLMAAQGTREGNVGIMPYNAQPQVVVPLTSLCRLHSGHGGAPCCRFEGECNFVHICKEIANQLSPESSPIAVATTVEGIAPAVNVYAIGSELVSSRAEAILLPKNHAEHSLPPAEMPMPLCASADIAATPTIRFDPLALAATVPSRPESARPMGVSPVTNRSFSFTPTNVLLWRHNPYGSSRTSSAIET